MRIFKLDKIYSIVCEWKNSTSGFKHEATLTYNGIGHGKTKMRYLNRTWERFEFESVLKKIVGEYFEGEQKEKYRNVINKCH